MKPHIPILAILLTFLMTPLFLWGQNTLGEDDVLYLHNGSILRGKIVEQVIGEYVKIEVISGQVFTIPTDEIERITIEPPLFSKVQLTKFNHFRPISYRKQGNLYQTVDWGLNFYQGEWGPLASTALHYRIVYHKSHLLNFGGGTGWDIYSEGTITPFFAELQGDLRKKPVTPTYLVQAGYGIAVSRSNNHDIFQGGPMGHAGVGIRFHTRSKTELALTVGYRFQHTYQEFREWPRDIWNLPPGVTPEPALVTGTRFYQRFHYQLSITL